MEAALDEQRIGTRKPAGPKILTNHLVPLITDQGDAISWPTERLSGKPFTSNCGTLPGRP